MRPQILVLLLAFGLWTPLARAQFEGTYEVAFKKQEEKKASRWSLADWLQQKQKNQAADLWLAKNSHSSTFEFLFELQSVNYDQFLTSTPDVKTNHNSYGAAVAAYAGVAGLRGGYEGDNENRGLSYGSINLRIFGRALQDTHVNLEYGIRGLNLALGGIAGVTPANTSENFQNQYGAVTTNLYLTKHFGLEGVYRKILPAASNLGRQMQGESSQAGVFIDFNIVRFYGTWRKDFLTYDGPASASSSEFREGFGGGMRVYF